MFIFSFSEAVRSVFHTGFRLKVVFTRIGTLPINFMLTELAAWPSADAQTSIGKQLDEFLCVFCQL